MSDIDDLRQIIHHGIWLNFDDLEEEIIAAGFHRDRTIEDATPADLIEAAWDAAYPVPEGRKIPANTGYLSWRNGECVGIYSKGVSYDMPVRDGYLERRTLDPLPPVIPEGCDLVWAGNPDRRVVWHRDPSNPDRWNGYDVAGHAANLHRDNLIDPKPVPEEES